MQPHSSVAIVAVAALLLYFWMGLNVAGARRKTGIAAPSMVGDPLLERTVRVQMNTLEWLPIFLVGLWLFAVYWYDLLAAALGVVWILGRLIYALGYMQDASRRSVGFLIQFLAAATLLLGGLAGAIWSIFLTGA